MYYSLIGCFITVFFGWLISYIVGTTESDMYDENLIYPVALKISRWFPGSPRRYADKNPPQVVSNGKVPTVSFVVEKGDEAEPPQGTYRTKL